MRVLIVKTSSMGDLIHTFPALTDAKAAIPHIEFDWLVEEAFTAIPTWHPAVRQVLPIALRRLRRQSFNIMFNRTSGIEWRTMIKTLRAHQYDYVLDAQGLVKSAFFACIARGKRVGLDWSSAREALASLVYQQKCTVNFHQHAIVRMRQLFSQALGYALPNTLPDAGLARSQFISSKENKQKNIVFLPGTTWTSKMWPEEYWIDLAHLLGAKGYCIQISGGSPLELIQAARLAHACEYVEAFPRLSIAEMATLLANAAGVVTVDTGFGHLAAALGVPTVSIYGATNPEYTGAIGQKALCLAANFPCSPCLSRTCRYKESNTVTPACYSSVLPERVYQALLKLMD